MKKIIGTALAAGAAMLGATAATTSAANAEAAWSFNLGLATDYVFRGIDQTTSFSEGEAFGGIDATIAEQFYLGAWVSNTGAHAAQFIEYDLYGGWKPTLGPVALDLGFIYYGYTDADSTVLDESDYSNYELKLAGSIPAGPVTLGAQLYWTPDFGGDNTSFSGPSSEDSAFYYEANAAYTFGNKATLSGAIGHVDVEDKPVIDGYTTWNVGLTYPILDNLSIDGRFIGTEDDAEDAVNGFGATGDTLVATLKTTF